MSDYVLPDSRARDRRGATLTPIGWMIPAYCANCGAQHGMVLERDMLWCFVLCNKCEAWGAIAHFYKEPDHVYAANLAAEIAAAEVAAAVQGMSGPEALAALEKKLGDPSSAIGKLANDWQRRLGKER